MYIIILLSVHRIKIFYAWIYDINHTIIKKVMTSNFFGGNTVTGKFVSLYDDSYQSQLIFQIVGENKILFFIVLFIYCQIKKKTLHFYIKAWE